MRVPCSSCGDWTSVQAGSDGFRCGCGTLNTLRHLGPVSVARAPRAVALPGPRIGGRRRPARVIRPALSAISSLPSSLTGKVQKILVSLVVLAALGSAFHQGTFATFNATTTNATNTFGTGTVTMSNVAGTIVAGLNCASTPNGTCATIFGPSNAGALKPSTTDIANTVTITYTGSLSPTTDFRLYGAAYAAKTAASTALCTAPAAGAGNPGTAVDLMVTVGAASPTLVYPAQNTTTSAAITLGQAFSPAGPLPVNATTAALASGAQIILYSAGTYQQFTTSAAVAIGATSIPVVAATANSAYPIGSLVAPQGTLDNFATTYTTSANGIQLKGGTNGAGVAGQWATNDNSIFNIRVHLDAAANNTFQGCQSQSDLVWYATP